VAELFSAVLDSSSFTPISLDSFDFAVLAVALRISVASKMLSQLAVVLSEFASFSRIVSLASANWLVSFANMASSMSAVDSGARISNCAFFATVSVGALTSLFSTDCDAFSVYAVCLAFSFYSFDAAKSACPASLAFAASRIFGGDACSMFTAGTIDAARPESATESHTFQVFSANKKHRLVVDFNFSNASGKAP
jgi:hypothetical protein